MTRWRGSRQAAKMAKHLQLPFTDWVRYRVRFISTAYISGNGPALAAYPPSCADCRRA